MGSWSRGIAQSTTSIIHNHILCLNYCSNASMMMLAATAPGSFVPFTCSIFKYDERPASGFISAVAFAPSLAAEIISAEELPLEAASAAGIKLSRQVR